MHQRHQHSWPGDDWTIRPKHGIAYKIVFNGADFHAKLAAVEAGIGLVVMPESTVPSNLVKAKEYHLPPLPAIKVVLCVHLGLETGQRRPS